MGSRMIILMCHLYVWLWMAASRQGPLCLRLADVEDAAATADAAGAAKTAHLAAREPDVARNQQDGGRQPQQLLQQQQAASAVSGWSQGFLGFWRAQACSSSSSSGALSSQQSPAWLQEGAAGMQDTTAMARGCSCGRLYIRHLSKAPVPWGTHRWANLV